MAHEIVASAEGILDTSFPVLNHGYVRLVDYMGGDDRVVQSARVSYGAGTKTKRADEALIRYLMRNRHTSPFEQVVLTFHVKLPIFVARQWIRHRTARVNEISGRYSVLTDEFFVPETGDLGTQDERNRQGRREGGPLSDNDRTLLCRGFAEEQEQSYGAYNSRIEQGLAREIARINLPLSIYTEMYWQMDLHNLFHFLSLRLHPHAQREIREYAKVILWLAEHVAPVSVAAFREHELDGARVSAEELTALRGASPAIVDAIREYEGLSQKHKEELLAKLGLDDEPTDPPFSE